MSRKATIKDAIFLAKKYNIDLKVVPLKLLQYGLNVELEHGKRFGSQTNVSGDNLDITMRIVIAHLLEFPDYYQRLKYMEHEADMYWKRKNKPPIFK
jgi:hypothetical protein